MMNNYPIKTPSGTEVKLGGNKYNITQGLQKVSTNQSYDVAQSMNDTEK